LSSKAPTGGVDVHRSFIRTAFVVLAFACGLVLAFGFQRVVDDETQRQSPGVNVRGSLARAIAADGLFAEDPRTTPAVEVAPDAEPPSPAAATADDAVRRFLDFEVAREYEESYGLLSAADRAREVSRRSWSAGHADLPEITGYQISGATAGADRADVPVELALRPELTPSEGLVAARATAVFSAVAEDGGWRVAFAETTLAPEYPSPSGAPDAVRDWVHVRRACRAAPEYAGGLIGAAARADLLCGSEGPVRTGRVRTLPESVQDQPFLAAFGSEVHDWARVVPVASPVRMDVVVAPLGERWLVVGVLQQPTERT
jgi:hypothetical protein